MGIVSNENLSWTDFQHSFLAFRTKAEKSYGRFMLEAICTINKEDGPEVYALGAGVLAGDVYGTGELMLSPPYTYQIVASEARHKIFRNYVSWDDARDTHGKNSKIFSEFHIDIHKKAGREVKGVEELIESVKKNHPLNGQVNLASGFQDLSVRIDFPIKHINIHPQKKLFQTETGPIVLPEDLLYHKKLKKPPMFNTAYVFFNRFDCLDFALWSPAAVGSDFSRFYSKKHRMNAEIRIFIQDSTC